MLRVENREKLDAELEIILATIPVKTMREKMQAAQVAFASVNGVKELSEHPQLRRIKVPTAQGSVNLVAPPAHIRNEPRDFGPVPTIGQHTDAIRKEFATPAS